MIKKIQTIVVELKADKKMLVVLGVVFFVGFAGGALTEHIVHLVQGHNTAHASAEEHIDHHH